MKDIDMENERAVTGDNNPPSQIDEIMSAWDGSRSEAEGWLDGSAVENLGQMNAVDALGKDITAAIKDLKAGEASEAKPLYDAWKLSKASWKPTIDDMEAIKKGLADITRPFKKKLADEKEAAKRAAYDKAREAEREAQAKIDAAQAGDIEAQREAIQAQQDALDAKKDAAIANKDTVKGLRNTWFFEVQDMGALVNWIARNDKAAMAEFAEEYARRNHQNGKLGGVRSRQENV